MRKTIASFKVCNFFRIGQFQAFVIIPEKSTEWPMEKFLTDLLAGFFASFFVLRKSNSTNLPKFTWSWLTSFRTKLPLYFHKGLRKRRWQQRRTLQFGIAAHKSDIFRCRIFVSFMKLTLFVFFMDILTIREKRKSNLFVFVHTRAIWV